MSKIGGIMAFVRTKKIKNYEYAYLVENKWKQKKSKQKVKKYLGRVYRFEKKDDNDFFKFMNISNTENYVKSSNVETMIKDLVKFEALRHGFKEDSEILTNGDCLINIKDNKVRNQNNSDVAIAINEGFLSTYSIKNLLKMRKEGNEEEVYFIAKAFIESGISIPKEVFIGIYSKLKLKV